MYVAGVVENGARIDNEANPQTSGGRDDIFVTLMETEAGSAKWVKQVGSNGDDRLACGGGVVTNANGNAVVYGDTTGKLQPLDPNP